MSEGPEHSQRPVAQRRVGPRSIGASKTALLVDLAAEDLQIWVGLKPLEQKRLLRSVAKWEAESGSV
jgi:hypothetical protein